MADNPNSRVVPKNLLISAMHAVSEQSVTEGNVRESNVRDLCTLINLSVLYDQIETLGHRDECNRNIKPNIASEYLYLEKNTGLTIRVGPKDADYNETITHGSAAAAYMFALKHRSVDVTELSQVLGRSLRIHTSDQPDYWEDFDEGRQLLSTSTLSKEFSEAEKFWLRTFLYAGLANARQLPLVPDAIRTWGQMAAIPGTPDDYCRQLETAVRSKYSQESIRNLILDTPFPVPPFAAMVLIKTKGDPSKIWDETKELRDKLEHVRSALSNLQLERNTADYSGLITTFGMRHTSKSKNSLDDQVTDAIETMRKLKFSLPPQLLVLKPMYDIVTAATSLMTNPIERGFKAFNTLKELHEMVSTGRELGSWSDRYIFAEVHYQLGWGLRSWLNDGVRLEHLFGSIKIDEPLWRS